MPAKKIKTKTEDLPSALEQPEQEPENKIDFKKEAEALVEENKILKAQLDEIKENAPARLSQEQMQQLLYEHSCLINTTRKMTDIVLAYIPFFDVDSYYAHVNLKPLEEFQNEKMRQAKLYLIRLCKELQKAIDDIVGARTVEETFPHSAADMMTILIAAWVENIMIMNFELIYYSLAQQQKAISNNNSDEARALEREMKNTIIFGKLRSAVEQIFFKNHNIQVN